MRNSDIENIKTLKNSTQITLSNNNMGMTVHESVKVNVIKAIMLGVSPNVLRQISDIGLTDDDYVAIFEAKERVGNIFSELESLLGDRLTNIKTENHKFK